MTANRSWCCGRTSSTSGTTRCAPWTRRRTGCTAGRGPVRRAEAPSQGRWARRWGGAWPRGSARRVRPACRRRGSVGDRLSAGGRGPVERGGGLVVALTRGMVQGW